MLLHETRSRGSRQRPRLPRRRSFGELLSRQPSPCEQRCLYYMFPVLRWTPPTLPSSSLHGSCLRDQTCVCKFEQFADTLQPGGPREPNRVCAGVLHDLLWRSARPVMEVCTTHLWGRGDATWTRVLLINTKKRCSCGTAEPTVRVLTASATSRPDSRPHAAWPSQWHASRRPSQRPSTPNGLRDGCITLEQ